MWNTRVCLGKDSSTPKFSPIKVQRKWNCKPDVLYQMFAILYGKLRLLCVE